MLVFLHHFNLRFTDMYCKGARTSASSCRSHHHVPTQACRLLGEDDSTNREAGDWNRLLMPYADCKRRIACRAALLRSKHSHRSIVVAHPLPCE